VVLNNPVSPPATLAFNWTWTNKPFVIFSRLAVHPIARAVVAEGTRAGVRRVPVEHFEVRGYPPRRMPKGRRGVPIEEDAKGAKRASGGYTYTAKVRDLPSFKGRSLPAPCRSPNVTIRSFCAVAAGDARRGCGGRGGHGGGPAAGALRAFFEIPVEF
jgi:hypothetical protein